jgi:hypothetical protein
LDLKWEPHELSALLFACSKAGFEAFYELLIPFTIGFVQSESPVVVTNDYRLIRKFLSRRVQLDAESIRVLWEHPDHSLPKDAAECLTFIISQNPGECSDWIPGIVEEVMRVTDIQTLGFYLQGLALLLPENVGRISDAVLCHVIDVVADSDLDQILDSVVYFLMAALRHSLIGFERILSQISLSRIADFMHI